MQACHVVPGTTKSLLQVYLVTKLWRLRQLGRLVFKLRRHHWQAWATRLPRHLLGPDAEVGQQNGASPAWPALHRTKRSPQWRSGRTRHGPPLLGAKSCGRNWGKSRDIALRGSLTMKFSIHLWHFGNPDVHIEPNYTDIACGCVYWLMYVYACGIS